MKLDFNGGVLDFCQLSDTIICSFNSVIVNCTVKICNITGFTHCC